jgi:translation initiation factor IF-2
VAVRIYSVAKELNVDSKELVDICNKIGITGKGSALASLDDDEVARIKKHLAGAAAPPTPHPQAPIPPTPGPVRQIVNIPSPSTPAPQPVAPAPQPPISSPLKAPVARQPVAPEVVAPPPVEKAPDVLTRESYIPVANSGGKMRVLGSRTKAPVAGDAKPPTDEKKKRKDREPVINLAKIPKSGSATVVAKKDEPAPQKPEIKLTKELIVGTRQGMRAPLDNFVQQETQKGNNAGSGSSTGSPSKTGSAMPVGGLTEFKANAENKNRVKTKKEMDFEEEERERKKKGLAGLAASRADRSKRRGKQTDEEAFQEEERNRRGRTLVRRGGNTALPRKEKVAVELPCTVRDFSESAGIQAGRVLLSLMKLGVKANINSSLENEQAMMVATDLGLDIEFKEHQTLEQNVLANFENVQDDPDDLVTRPPVVTFLGHVDHGKTSLLDYLIGTKIVTGEAGGITQHIRAYQVEKDGRHVSFVDTPGHEAFTEMRARGANVTDIAILVIAADDGIMPQTEEAISHAKAAGVPIIVALNKIDMVSANPNRVMTQMTEHGLTPSEWGGDVEVVPTSAITGQGMDDLLETILTVAELHDYKANPKRAANGLCLESEQESNRGVIAKVIIQNGTLRVGDIVVCGSTFGRVKALYDTLKPNRQLTEAGPSMPVNITGLDKPPAAGERFYVLDDIVEAREIAASREVNSRAQVLSGSTPKVSFETFQELLQTGRLGKKEDHVVLNMIIRADTRGSLEAIEKELTKLDHPEVDIRILQKSVGGVSVADVTLASASQGVIVGFNVIPDEAARMLAEERNVEIRRYDIIYNLTNDIRALVEGRLKPEERVVELGRALVKQVFSISRVGTIAGCIVVQGSIERGCRIRVNRDGRTIGEYALETLKRIKDDVKEVPRGMECGIKLAGFNDLKQDDILEAYKIEEFARTLELSAR